MVFRKATVVILGLLAGLTCNKMQYYEDKPIHFAGTVFLAHRGGQNDTLRENTLESCVNALKYTDGLEVDVQMSKDRTIWLSHSPVVEFCGKQGKCFAETRDSEIESITTCNGVDIRYTKLEELLVYMNKNNLRRFISLDLKGWAPCSGNSADIEGMMRAEVEELLKLGEDYRMTPYFIIETQLASVLNWAKKKNHSVKVYITSFGDFEKGMLLALKHNLDGISFKSNFKDELDAEKINLLHKKGLRMMAWNIPDSSYMQFLQSINVDFIQFDM